MKKFILPIILISMAAHLHAQRIFSDQQNEHERYIDTFPVTFADYKKGFSYDLSVTYKEIYQEADTIKQWRVGFWLTLGHPSKMDEGQRILLKFEDGSIMERYLSYPLTEANFSINRVYNVITYKFTPFYDFSEEDIDYISEHRIVKIRLEAEWNARGYFEYEVAPHSKVWRPSEVIKTLSSAIRARLQSRPHNTIYDDF